MKPTPDNESHLRDEARITAFLLGELSETDSIQLEQDLKSDPSLKKRFDKLQQTSEMLKSAGQSGWISRALPESDWRLSPESRQRILDQFRSKDPRKDYLMLFGKRALPLLQLIQPSALRLGIPIAACFLVSLVTMAFWSSTFIKARHASNQAQHLAKSETDEMSAAPPASQAEHYFFDFAQESEEMDPSGSESWEESDMSRQPARTDEFIGGESSERFGRYDSGRDSAGTEVELRRKDSLVSERQTRGYAINAPASAETTPAPAPAPPGAAAGGGMGGGGAGGMAGGRGGAVLFAQDADTNLYSGLADEQRLDEQKQVWGVNELAVIPDSTTTFGINSRAAGIRTQSAIPETAPAAVPRSGGANAGSELALGDVPALGRMFRSESMSQPANAEPQRPKISAESRSLPQQTDQISLGAAFLPANDGLESKDGFAPERSRGRVAVPTSRFSNTATAEIESLGRSNGRGQITGKSVDAKNNEDRSEFRQNWSFGASSSDKSIPGGTDYYGSENVEFSQPKETSLNSTLESIDSSVNSDIDYGLNATARFTLNYSDTDQIESLQEELQDLETSFEANSAARGVVRELELGQSLEISNKEDAFSGLGLEKKLPKLSSATIVEEETKGFHQAGRVKLKEATRDFQEETAADSNPFSTFALQVRDVSFKSALAAFQNGSWPEPETMRSEEFLNAFDYGMPEPDLSSKVALEHELSTFPFEHQRLALRVSLKTAALGREANRPMNLVAVLDNSGSMERPDRAAITQGAFEELANSLNPQDRLSVIAFSRQPRLWMEATPGGDPLKILTRLGELNPEGGTNLEAALDLAYEIAQRNYVPQGENRVVLMTDGAANLGQVNPDALAEQVMDNRRQGIALDTYGIGWDGLNDPLLERLSRNGDGRYAFLNDPRTAPNEFAEELAGALQVAAKQVKIQLEWNPDRVHSYRLIGYSKNRLTAEQFRDNSVDAGELAAKEAGSAIYTLELKPDGVGPIAIARARYQDPDSQSFEEKTWTIPFSVPPALDESSPAHQLAVVSSLFGERLSNAPRAEQYPLSDLLDTLQNIKTEFAFNPRVQQLEFMLQQAQALSNVQP